MRIIISEEYRESISDVIVIADTHNFDHNNISEIASAFAEIPSAMIESIDIDRGAIRGTLPTKFIPELKNMEGVKYVRPILQYQKHINNGETENQYESDI